MKELAIIIPTYNESSNLPVLVKRIGDLNLDTEYEIIVVDDNSPDKTWKTAVDLQKQYNNMKSIRRLGRSGLSSAVIEGILATNTKFFAVIDADLQHDETKIPDMLNAARNGANIVIGSRYIEGGGVGDWSQHRKKISRWATNLALKIFKHNISDPMSGFFLMERKYLDSVVESLDAKGFKILLDILSNYKPGEIIIKEIPYQFKDRMHGESKLTPIVALQFLEFIYSKILGRYIPLRFFKFISVGSLGAFVHFTMLYLCFKKFNISYELSLMIAIESAIIFNFFLNNIWTFRDSLLLGKKALLFGLLKFNLASLFGGMVSFVMSVFLMNTLNIHWATASITGAVAGALWNYQLNLLFTWKVR
jgi:dolichol-phosphate mannosyltransferase